MQNCISELWNLLYFAAPMDFPNESSFIDAYGDISNFEQVFFFFFFFFLFFIYFIYLFIYYYYYYLFFLIYLPSLIPFLISPSLPPPPPPPPQVEKLQQNLRPFLLRRLKEDVEKAIPPQRGSCGGVGDVRYAKTIL